MTDTVFLFGSHISKGMVEAFRAENRVVAKALCPTPLSCYLAVDNAFKQVFLLDATAAAGTDVFLLNQGNDSAEAGFAVVFIGKFTE